MQLFPREGYKNTFQKWRNRSKEVLPMNIFFNSSLMFAFGPILQTELSRKWPRAANFWARFENPFETLSFTCKCLITSLSQNQSISWPKCFPGFTFLQCLCCIPSVWYTKQKYLNIEFINYMHGSYKCGFRFRCFIHM